MEYKMLLLTAEESKSAMNCGLTFALANKNRWVKFDVENPQEHIGTYDVSKTFVAVDNVAYTIFKDYIFPNEKIRLFILKDRQMAIDI